MAETCLQRWAWVFKTESTIIPSLALELGASTRILGLFPTVSRACGLLPQILFARLIEPRSRKKPILLTFTLLFASFWAAAGLLFLLAPAAGPAPDGPLNELTGLARRTSPLLWIFLALYAGSWVCLAGRNVALSSARGKLVPVELRGRLSGIGILGGGLGSSLITFFVIRPLIDTPQRSLASFGWLFIAVAVGFLVVVLAVALARDPPRREPAGAQSLGTFFRSAVDLLRTDVNYRRAVMLQFCFVASFTLMMFYTSYAKELIPDQHYRGYVGIFLTVQVLTQSVWAPIMGLLADRHGNRFVLRILAVITPLWPLSAIVLGRFATAHPAAYAPVFVFVGSMLPTTFIMVNYLLEIAPEGKQATYVGTANTVMTLTVLLPFPTGWIIEKVGYVAVFYGLAVLMILAVVMAARLEEPRHRRPPAPRALQPGEPRPL